MTEYVLGFMFDCHGNVALVRKKKGPGDQAGKLNGFGGVVEEGEDTGRAMRREFIEESGWVGSPGWYEMGSFSDPDEADWKVHCFWAIYTNFYPFQGSEDVEVYKVDEIPEPTVDKVRELIDRVLEDDRYQRGQAA